MPNMRLYYCVSICLILNVQSISIIANSLTKERDGCQIDFECCSNSMQKEVPELFFEINTNQFRNCNQKYVSGNEPKLKVVNLRYKREHSRRQHHNAEITSYKVFSYKIPPLILGATEHTHKKISKKPIIIKNVSNKKKKHKLSNIFLPFLKLFAFFSVLNPFSIAVYIFMIMSPVIFSVLAFTALSLMLKPFLHLLFAVKHFIVRDRHKRRKKFFKRQRSKKLPLTLHKHYYYKSGPPSSSLRTSLPRPTQLPYILRNEYWI